MISKDGTHASLDTALWLVLLAAVLILGGYLRVISPAPGQRSPDEWVYINYATRIAANPLDAPRDLVHRYNLNSGDWIYPIPLRIGYYYLLAGVLNLSHLSAEQSGVAISTAASILQLLVLTAFGLRFFNSWTVLVALALLAVSPEDLAMSRRVWGDGVCGCVAMIFIWLCVEASVHRHKWPWLIALWLCGGYLMLLKESGAFVFGPCVLGLMTQSWIQARNWKPVLWIAAGSGITAFAAFIIMALLCGGVPAALETVRHSAQAAPLNQYGIEYQSGPWYSLPLALGILSPFTAFGCGMAAIALILPRDSLSNVLSLNRSQKWIAICLAALIVLIIAAVTIPPALKNLRYISFIFAPWYLFGALGLTYTLNILIQLLGPRARAPLIIMATFVVLISCSSDYSRYRDLVIKGQLADLNVRHVVTYPFAR